MGAQILEPDLNLSSLLHGGFLNGRARRLEANALRPNAFGIREELELVPGLDRALVDLARHQDAAAGDVRMDFLDEQHEKAAFLLFVHDLDLNDRESWNVFCSTLNVRLSRWKKECC